MIFQIYIQDNLNMNSSNSFSLEEYQIQRQYREEKRKHFLTQYELFRQRLGLVQGQIKKPSLIVEKSNAVPQNEKSGKLEHQQSELTSENNKLKEKLSELQSEERQKLNKFKQQISGAKQQYIEKIKEISEIANSQKSQTQAKIVKMEEQIKASSLKNQEIEEFNKKVEQECKKANQIMEKYSNEVQKEYDQKLLEFSAVFNSSNQKIKTLEQQYNEQQFIDATLQNEQLINSIKDNAEKADEQIEKIVADYRELLSGKTQILDSLRQNNKMKEDQIEKMAMLEEKMKIIFEKINEQKKIYLEENKKMAEELVEVKELLTKAMGG